MPKTPDPGPRPRMEITIPMRDGETLDYDWLGAQIGRGMAVSYEYGSAVISPRAVMFLGYHPSDAGRAITLIFTIDE